MPRGRFEIGTNAGVTTEPISPNIAVTRFGPSTIVGPDGIPR